MVRNMNVMSSTAPCTGRLFNIIILPEGRKGTPRSLRRLSFQLRIKQVLLFPFFAENDDWIRQLWLARQFKRACIWATRQILRLLKIRGVTHDPLWNLNEMRLERFEWKPKLGVWHMPASCVSARMALGERILLLSFFLPIHSIVHVIILRFFHSFY